MRRPEMNRKGLLPTRLPVSSSNGLRGLLAGMALLGFGAPVAGSPSAAPPAHSIIWIVISAAAAVGFCILAVFLLIGRRSHLKKIRHLEDMLREMEKETVFRGFSASIAHDLNNLLMALSGHLDLLRETGGRSEALDRTCALFEGGVSSLRLFMGRLSESSRVGTRVRFAPVDLQSLLTNLAELTRRHPAFLERELECEVSSPFVARLDGALLQDAIMNMLINAAQAAGPGGRVVLHVAQDARFLRIQVHDSGPGVNPSQENLLFDPGYSTKAGGPGSGMIAVRQFISSCGGECRVDRSHLGGALFELRIPLRAVPPGSP